MVAVSDTVIIFIEQEIGRQARSEDEKVFRSRKQK